MKSASALAGLVYDDGDGDVGGHGDLRGRRAQRHSMGVSRAHSTAWVLAQHTAQDGC